MIAPEPLILNLRRFSHTIDENLLLSIKKDHSLIKYLFEQFLEKKTVNDHLRISNEIIRQISIHSVAEEIVVYPLILEKLGEKEYQESLQDHSKLKKELYQLSSIFSNVESEEFYKLFTKVLEDFVDHSDKEETDILIKLTEKLTPEEDRVATEAFIKKRENVPTRPHPSAPDTQPTENIIATLQAPADKFLDKTMRSFPTVIM